jgi:hypothetical protein
MTEVKVLCGCGQKFKFDVEPVNGRMPFSVNCPICGIDGTPAANAILSQFVPVGTMTSAPAPVMAVPPPVAVAPSATPIRLHMPVPAAPAPAPVAVAAPVEAPMVVPGPITPLPAVIKKAPKSPGERSIGMGILGAFLGAIIGSGAMYAFAYYVGFRFPFMGVATGFFTGYGARLMFKDTNSQLGSISAIVAAIAVTGTLYLIFDGFPLINIISVVVSISVAYRCASG